MSMRSSPVSSQRSEGTQAPACQPKRGNATTNVANAPATINTSSGPNVPEAITTDQVDGADICGICMCPFDSSLDAESDTNEAHPTPSGPPGGLSSPPETPASSPPATPKPAEGSPTRSPPSTQVTPSSGQHSLPYEIARFVSTSAPAKSRPTPRSGHRVLARCAAPTSSPLQPLRTPRRWATKYIRSTPSTPHGRFRPPPRFPDLIALAPRVPPHPRSYYLETNLEIPKTPNPFWDITSSERHELTPPLSPPSSPSSSPTAPESPSPAPSNAPLSPDATDAEDDIDPTDNKDSAESNSDSDSDSPLDPVDPLDAPIIRFSRCRHIFHGECAHKWLLDCINSFHLPHGTCPNCRTPYTHPGIPALETPAGVCAAAEVHLTSPTTFDALGGFLEGQDWGGLDGMDTGADGDGEGEDDALDEEDLAAIRAESEEDARADPERERERRWGDGVEAADWAVARTDVDYAERMRERGG